MGPGFFFRVSLIGGFDVADNGPAASLNIDLPDQNLLWTTPAFPRFDKIDDSFSALHGVSEICIDGFRVAGLRSARMAIHHTVHHGDR